MTMTTTTPPSSFPPPSGDLNFYTFANFRRGYADWWREMLFGPAPGEQPAPSTGKRPAKASSVAWLILVIPALILVLALVVPVLTRPLVGVMNFVGTDAVASGAMGGAVLMGAAVCIGVPFLVFRRARRFYRSCCLRGAELALGFRTPAGPRR